MLSFHIPIVFLLSSAGEWRNQFEVLSRLFRELLFLALVDGAMNDRRPMIIGYFPNWNSGREGAAFDITNIDPSLYTHLIYAFVGLDKKTFGLKSTNQWIDVKEKGYKRFTDLKTSHPKLKLMISLGGWTDSNKNKITKYFQLVSNTKNICKFVQSVLAFLGEFKFDGLDLNWKYPNTETDRIGFINLIVALSNAFKPYGYLLSAAVPPTVSTINAGYDVPSLNKNLDFINVMAYDFHGPWSSEADHHSPLRQRLREKNSELNADFAINYWIHKGMSPVKINLGIPLYGSSWILSSDVITPPAPAQSPNQEMAYYEICDVIRNQGWKVYKTSQAIGPCAVSPASPKIWVGYDDPAMAIAKTNYILSKGLGGVMLWDISMDDFQGISGEGPNPVTKSIIRTISQDIPVCLDIR